MTNHPRIGIRPTIDGRRKGVREALEEQTMNMAKSVADLFTENFEAQACASWTRPIVVSAMTTSTGLPSG